MNTERARAPGPNRPRQGRPALRIIPIAVPLAVGAAISGTVLWSAWPFVRPAREIDVAQVLYNGSLSLQPTADTERTNTSAAGVQAPGWLEADPFLIACSGLADGIIASVDVLEGDFVQQGQIVARLVPDDAELGLASAVAQLARAEATLAEAEAELRASQTNWDHPIDAHRAIEAGRAALAESEAELARLPSMVASARARLVALQEQRDRVRSSSQRNVANDIELILAQQGVEAQRHEVAATEATRGVLEARRERLRAELAFAERHLELRVEDRRRVDAAEANVRRLRADVDQATTRRDEAALELDRMSIRAPVAGYVQRRIKVPGDKLVRMMDSPHSTHVVHLYDPASLQVRVDVPLADAAGVSVGQPCEVIVEVLPDRVFRGEVTRIMHEADLQKNTLQVKVRVIDPDPLLRPEMLTRVKFLRSSTPSRVSGEQSRRDGRLLVPSDAIAQEDDPPVVWLVTDRRRSRGVLEPRPVRIVGRDGAWTAVDAELHPGDLIAATPRSAQAGEPVVLRREPADGQDDS